MSIKRGIVLQHQLPTHHRCMLFDEEMGRIFVSITAQKEPPRLTRGSLITYQIRNWRTLLCITNPQALCLPAPELCHDLTFLHQVLRVLNKFLPEGAHNAELFDAVLALYEPQHAYYLCDDIGKKLFLCKLFALLGIYPDELIFRQSPRIHRLILLPMQHLHTGVLPMQDYGALNSWLMGCLASA